MNANLRVWLRLGALCLSGAAINTAGCAAHWVGQDGARRAVGLLYVREAPAPPESSLAGVVTDIQTLGLSGGVSGEGPFLSLGFRRDRLAHIRNNRLVLGNPVTDISTQKPETLK